MDHLPRIVINTIPHKSQEYDTAGDYKEMDNRWVVSISRLPDWRHEFLVLLHEMCEMALTKHHEVDWASIDDFDMNGAGKDHPDPGILTDAPYHTQHVLATQIEKKFAKYLGVEWVDYNDALDKLEYT
jgi:hypothetical protein